MTPPSWPLICFGFHPICLGIPSLLLALVHPDLHGIIRDSHPPSPPLFSRSDDLHLVFTWSHYNSFQVKSFYFLVPSFPPSPVLGMPISVTPRVQIFVCSPYSSSFFFSCFCVFVFCFCIFVFCVCVYLFWFLQGVRERRRYPDSCPDPPTNRPMKAYPLLLSYTPQS